MKRRLQATIAILVVATVALVALRFFSGAPPTRTATTNATDAAVTPTAPAVSSVAPADAAVVASAAASPAPSPSPSPSTDANLLGSQNGAFVRSWTDGGVADDPQCLPQEACSIALVPAYARPVTLLFELPAIARLERIAVSVRGTKRARVEVAVGSDARHVHVVGDLAFALPADNSTEHALALTADARYVRFTIVKSAGDSLSFASASATGTPGAPQHGRLDGFWLNIASTGSATQIGGSRGRVPTVAPSPDRNDDRRVAIVEDAHLALFACRERYDPWQATLADGIARGGRGAMQLSGNGDLLVGNDGGHPIIAMRVKASPACESSTTGSGPTVATFVRVLDEPAPEIARAMMPRRRIEAHFAPLLTRAQLERATFAVLDGDCTASTDLSPRRQRILLDWIRAGHKLVIRDADTCTTSDYSFLPYRFATKATGRLGMRGTVLAIADPSTLGATQSDAAHVLDVAAYLKAADQQIGDADIMQTDDPHWCGHLYATNAVHANGWVHAYARYGRGLIIYDGFDRDDLTAHIPAARRLVDLEYAQPARATLPCNARVASLLALYPSVDRRLPAGKAIVVRVPMQLIFNARPTTDRDARLTIEGDARFPARVTPTRVRLRGGRVQSVAVSVSLPNGWTGSHAYTVEATGAYGASARATVFIDGSVALAKAFESQRRVRLYGIHFDVASARIQPVSEATIAQIAQVLAAHSDWSLRVEGHTDGDGGAAYNLGLSTRRAASVVDDLVTRYHVRRARLHAAGFGLTKPVAPNGTDAGKALNRRVELVRL